MKLKTFKYNFFKTIIPGVFVSGLIGIIVGIVIFFYKYLAEIVLHQGKSLYLAISNNPIFIILGFIVLILLAFISCLITKKVPSSRGGGIPTSEGVIRGSIDYNWFQTLISTIFLSMISFFIGLPLGTEGPSVQIGTSVSYGIEKIFHLKFPEWKKYLMTGGASAAFSVATSAPITGIIFALEEIHRKFSPMILIVSFSSVLSASTISYLLSNLFNIRYQLFHKMSLPILELKLFPLMILFGLVIGILAVLFNKLMKLSQKILDEGLIKLKPFFKLLISFSLSFIIGLFLIDYLGGGHGLLESLISKPYKLSILIILLVLKFILIPITSQSGTTGGLFIPILLIGGLIGAVFSTLFKLEQYYVLFIFIGMSSFMGASIGCPLSALTFSVEALYCVENILPLSIACLFSYVVVRLFNAVHIYDLVLERRLKKDYGNKKFQIVEFKAQVMDNSFAIGKLTRDILFSVNIVILSVKRKDKDYSKMDNFGEKVIKAHDTILFRAQTYNIEATEKEICDFLGKQEIKHKIIQI